jgi:phage repressor protein C with HTH and peptisase S24 domain
MDNNESQKTKKAPSNNVRKIRKAFDISAKELAELTGWTEMYIYSVEKQERPLGEGQIRKLCRAFQCSEEELNSPGELLSKFLQKRANMLGSSINSTRNINSYTAGLGDNSSNNKDEDTITIPMYDSLASAGQGITSYNNDVRMQISFDFFISTTELKISRNNAMNNRYFFLEVRGDSMSPFLENGNIVMIDSTQKSIEHYKQVMVFRDIDSNIYIKELYKSPGRLFNIVSYNPNYKSDLDFTAEQIIQKYQGEIEIIGRVIWRGSAVGYYNSLSK